VSKHSLRERQWELYFILFAEHCIILNEHDMQSEFFYRIRILEKEEPILKLLHAVPNQAAWKNAKKYTAEGMRKGWPDCAFPVKSACGSFHSLYIEFKTDKGRLTDEQVEYLNLLTESGAMCVVCRDAEIAVELVMEYLKETGEPDKPLPDRLPRSLKLDIIVCNN